MSLILGVDVGTSSTKALLCNERGKIVAELSASHPLYSPRPGWNEQDPSDWWLSTVQAVNGVIAKARASKSDIKAIGLSGQMHGSVFLDGAGQPLGRALLWNDQRTVAECTEITRRAGGRKELIKLVNNIALTGYQAPKILWFRKHEKAAFKKLKKVLLPKDFIRLKMTGEMLSEPSDSSGTLLLDVKNRRWSHKLLAKLDLDADLMPRLIESTEIGSALSRGAAAELGLLPGIPVVGGAGDQPAGAVGMGVVEAGVMSATIGTSGVVFSPAKKFVANTDGLVQAFCHAVENQWCVFGCMLSAGASLEWFQKTLGQDHSIEQWLSRASATGSQGLVFLPYLDGERCPYPDPNASACFIGLNRTHTRDHMARAVLEGITFGMRDQLGLMKQLGLKVREIRLGGGGAKNAFWRQLQTDIYGATTVQVDTENASAFGAALLAGVGAGFWPSVQKACRVAVHVEQTLKPGTHHKSYNRTYDLFHGLYPTLQSTFAEHAL